MTAVCRQIVVLQGAQNIKPPILRAILRSIVVLWFGEVVAHAIYRQFLVLQRWVSWEEFLPR
jgi:hypothetical protein